MERISRCLITWLVIVLVAAPVRAGAQDAAQASFSREEIEQMVAPIALYPDALVAQILMASTYPLEVVSAARWVKANPNVKSPALEDAMQKQPWDPSIKSLTALPQVLAMMNEKLDMTQRLGDAFLGQPKDVMDAVQRLRAKAHAAGNLKTSKEQKVTTEQQGGVTVIKIEPAQPEVVYVPLYNPTVVYGPWPYAAYPPYYYYPPNYVAGTALFAFTAGVIVGNAMWGDCNWHGGTVNVNVNKYNSFNRTSISTTQWNHNTVHRKGVHYRDTTSQQKYGKAQQPGTGTREAYRGHAAPATQDLARSSAVQLKASAAPARTADRATPTRQAAAFEGIDRGAEARAFSDRGAASRASAETTRMARGGAGARGGERSRAR